MKIYKKIQKAFGGASLYFDKTMLKYIKCLCGDEVSIELIDDKIIITKSDINNSKIQRILDVKKS